ncbi:MAG: proline--tRNA ligase [Dehalococcoidia bacterium]|nr:proline--tRNA ligase [Dehalococcoidia bacterium]
MRLSKLFAKTQREIPAEADTISHRLLLRGGMISQVATGVYTYQPLAWRSLRKIEQIIREEIDRAGGQEVSMPVLQPIELWQKSGRDQALGKTLFKLVDRRDHTLVLGPTHEEVVTDIVIHNIRSYRDLPVNIYQIQTKFRDEPRPRAGLIRGREFAMMDAYSFDRDQAGLDTSYQKMLSAYKAILARCGTEATIVEADSGAIGGKDSLEFMLLTDSGEDTIIICRKCGYAANAEKARFNKGGADNGRPLPLEEVSTPGMQSIEQVAGFLNVPAGQTLKAVFYVADGNFIFVVIRGDLPVNEIKLKNTLKANDLRMATEAEVLEKGIVPGSASPIGIKNVKVIADDSVEAGTNFIAGGNKPDTHVKNVNYPRDFKADVVTDIALARAGDTCPHCSTPFTAVRGIEVGHIFKLGTLYSEKLGAYYTDENGVSRIIVMGCYGIGLSRLLAAAIEQHHDDKGIIWPVPIAPYHVYLCALYREGTKVDETAEKLYADLQTAGIEVLFDDRKESPGVKFNDADLLGIPLRVTVSARTLEKESAEVKWRAEKEAQLLPLEDLVTVLKQMLAGKMRA